MTDAQQDAGELRALAIMLDAECELGWMRTDSALEIGTWEGGMARWLGGRFHRVETIDLYAGATIVGDSHAPATLKAAAELGPYDLVFIDGDHSYAGAMRDFELYHLLVRPPGIVCLHDIRANGFRHEVGRVWREIVSAGKWRCREIAYWPDVYGIGCVFIT